MEGQIRKDRQKQIYARKEAIQKFINILAITLLCFTIIGFIALLVYLWYQKK